MADGFHVEGRLNRLNRFAFQQKGKGKFNKMIFIDTAFRLAGEDRHRLHSL
jgi:hypothetical protein